MAVSTSVRTIRDAWFQLNGIMCVYKPTNISCLKLRTMIITNICRDINQLEQSAPRSYVKIEPVVDANSFNDEPGVPSCYTVNTLPNLTDNELVRGPAIQNKDIKMNWGKTLGNKSSGVVILGVNRGTTHLQKFVQNRPTSVYQVKGILGLATDNHWDDGKVWEKSTFVHLTKEKLDRILSSIQAANQKNMFSYCGVDPNSQTAYELASKGLLRPAVKGPALVYGIKCVHFAPPNFTLEILCINEDEQYLATLVHDLGLTLKTNAVCQQIRCIRYGCFTVDDALLRKHWSLEHLPEHMSLCHTKMKSLPNIEPLLAAYDGGISSSHKIKETTSRK